MRNFIIVYSFLIACYANGQGIKRSAIGVMGTKINQGAISFQSIAGQSSLTVNRHGFIQPSISPVKSPNRTLAALPNPTRDQITIQGLIPGDLFSLVDLSGRHVVTVEVVARELVLDLSPYKAGIYIAHVKSPFPYTTLKIIKIN